MQNTKRFWPRITNLQNATCFDKNWCKGNSKEHLNRETFIHERYEECIWAGGNTALIWHKHILASVTNYYKWGCTEMQNNIHVFKIYKYINWQILMWLFMQNLKNLPCPIPKFGTHPQIKAFNIIFDHHRQ